MLTRIVMTYDEFERGVDALFAMDTELRGIVADEVEPAMAAVTEAVWQLVYSASLEGDLDTSNEGSRALQFGLVSQAAFARYLAGDDQARNQAEMTAGRALNLAKELRDKTTHAARKNWLATIAENLEIYQTSMLRGMEVSD